MDIKACLLLISKLQEDGVWNKWLETFFQETELSNSLKTPLQVESSDELNLPFSRMQQGNFPGIPSEWMKDLKQADLDGRCKLDISTTWSSIDGYSCTLTFIKASEQIHITTRSRKMVRVLLLFFNSKRSSRHLFLTALSAEICKKQGILFAHPHLTRNSGLGRASPPRKTCH